MPEHVRARLHFGKAIQVWQVSDTVFAGAHANNKRIALVLDLREPIGQQENSKEQASNKRIFHVRTIRAALLCAQKRTSPVEQAAK